MVSAGVISAACLSAALLTLQGCGGGDDPALKVGSCGAAKDVEDCQNVDFGSCGNACCRVEATVEGKIEDVVQALNNSLAAGGADGYYTLQGLFGPKGPGTGGLGFEALGSGAGYLGQVHHMTSGPKHYNDTIDFHITASEDAQTTTIRAFSLSLIGGALGDSGQGYKNIMMALQGATFGKDNGLTWDGALLNLDTSCPAPKKKKHAATLFLTDEVALLDRRLAGVAGTCGLDKNVTLADCHNKDLGTCGNACCSLKVTVAKPPAEAVVMLNESFVDGGADGNYTASLLAEGVTGFFNLTGKGVPGFPVIYIGQVIHTTNGGKFHFNDSVNFNLVPSEDGTGTVITAFSTSLVGGAYGDAGQNYKNLKMAMDHAFPDGATIEPGNFPKSCPAPTLV